MGERRRRLWVRAAPLVVLAVAAFATGVVVASKAPEIDAVNRFADAWVAQDFDAMHAELTPDAQAEYSTEEFQAAYERAQETATLTGIRTGDPRGPLEQDGETVVALPIDAETRSFGTISGEIAIPVADGAVAWRPSLVFPGLAQDEHLERKTVAPERAPILAADGSALAEGPASARTTNGAGGIVTGEVGEAPKARGKEMTAQGFPEDTPAGTSGLELAFDGRLAGTPGGKLLVVSDDDGGKRVLASSDPQRGKPLRTTIDPKLQDATAAALGDQFGGAALLDAENGDVLALAGIAFSAPQPPGSTFKVITTTAALEAGVTKPSEEFPVATSATVEGREIANAHDESCGGNLVTSFAESCNSVFAPLGVRVGADKLLDTAERFGFNSPPTLYDEEALAATQPPSSTIPDPIGSDLDVAVSAIGQGQVLATPLEMASVAQTIGNDGVRSPTSIVKGGEFASETGDVEVTSKDVAKTVKEMMIQVVQSGTGTAGAVPGVTVAGKTGTAEIGTSDGAPSDTATAGEAEQDVDAWFTAFAPADNPKYAVAVMIVDAGADGGTVAAPIAQQILSAALAS
jgi:cell division protein FtsI/penicillin-binding protein 2